MIDQNNTDLIQPLRYFLHNYHSHVFKEQFMVFEREKIQIMKLKTAIYFRNCIKSDIYRVMV